MRRFTGEVFVITKAEVVALTSPREHRGDVPVVTRMTVVPVAGRDSMRLSVQGAHPPFFTRNLVIVEDSSGSTGVGETVGGERVRCFLEAARSMVIGAPVGDRHLVLNAIRVRSGLDSVERPMRRLESRASAHALFAIDTAMLDLLGRFLRVPVASLLGEGLQRVRVPVLLTLAYVADASRTALPYRADADGSDDEWARVRHAPALSGEAVVQLADAAYRRYGLVDFRFTGGVFDADTEVRTIEALRDRFPDGRLSFDAGGTWAYDDSVRRLEHIGRRLDYVQRPCAADPSSNFDMLARWRRDSGVRAAARADGAHADIVRATALGTIDVALADPQTDSTQGAVRVAQACRDFAIDWSLQADRHFDISMATYAHVAAAAPGNVLPIDAAWLWHDGQRLACEPPEVRGGFLALPSGPGLGIELDRDEVAKAHALYELHRLSDCDDAIAMQSLVPGWRFDPQRPCLVR